MEIGLSQYSGAEFLQFYALLSVAAVVAAIWLPNWLRPDGRDQTVQDEEDLAFLAGGTPRHAETVIAGLMAKGALATQGRDKLHATRRADGEKGAARALLANPALLTWDEAGKVLRPEAKQVRERLVSRGLIMDGATLLQMRALSTLPLLFVMGLGLFRRSAGAAQGEPVGYLTISLVVLGIGTLVRFFAHDPRTRAGRVAVREAQERGSRMKRAPLTGETGAAVALFGTAVLVGTPLASLHAIRQANSGDGGGSSSSSDGSSSGCGGGGCGGCGG
jgi:uncharacterized protein (TIGR04222 family)